VIQAAGDAFLRAVKPGLKSPSAVTRAQAAFLLGDGANRRYASLLLPLLKDADLHVREQAAIALCRLHDASGLDTASAALQADRSWVRFYAVVALWTIGGQRATDALRKSAKGQVPLIELAIRRALAAALPSKVRTVPPKPLPLPGASVADAVDGAADAFAGEADWWWHAGDYDQVIRANQVVTFLDPHAVEQYTNSAWLLWSMGRVPEALAEYRRCITANPRNPHGYFYLGEYFVEHKQIAEAEPYLKQAVALAPQDARFRRSLAHVYEKLGKLKEALEEWDAILKDNPTDGAAIQNRARVQAALKGKAQ
jgi:tetratricopeptide (TPR) repeat protein